MICCRHSLFVIKLFFKVNSVCRLFGSMLLCVVPVIVPDSHDKIPSAIRKPSATMIIPVVIHVHDKKLILFFTSHAMLTSDTIKWRKRQDLFFFIFHELDLIYFAPYVMRYSTYQSTKIGWVLIEPYAW